MQTPYLIIKQRTSNLIGDLAENSPSMLHRVAKHYQHGHFSLLFFPPEHEIEKFENRVCEQDDSFYFEDGFMLRYPDAYVKDARDKLELFSMPSIELDGFFSRLVITGDELTVDGSGLYLQTLFSHASEDFLAISNNYSLIAEFLENAGIELTTNKLFYANHFFNQSLAYYANAGTPHNEIDYRDSLETIKIDDTISVSLGNKFGSKQYDDLSREKRLDLLHVRLSHLIKEYCEYIDVEVIGHNLTGGRDSRTSLALFMESQQEKLELSTSGYNYTHDRVISNYIAKKYQLPFDNTNEAPSSSMFDYERVMKFKHYEELFIPFFKNLAVHTEFNSSAFVASGYLGNVLTFAGGEANQVIRDNKYGLQDEIQRELLNIYDTQIAMLKSVYADDAHAIFNIMYNTTNKISSLCRRLKKNTLSIFESDFFQYCYFKESVAEKRNNSLHYELLRRSNKELLTEVPFESNKSFDSVSETYELQGFRGAARPRLYKDFVTNNLDAIVKHLRVNSHELSYLSNRFFELLEDLSGEDVPVPVCNKVYAALGKLESSGISFTDYAGPEEVDSYDMYTMDFFEQVYMENQQIVSGLTGVVYTDSIVVKAHLTLEEGEELRVIVKNLSKNERVATKVHSADVGYFIEINFTDTARHALFLNSYDKATKVTTPLYNTRFLVKQGWSEDADNGAPDELSTA